MESVINVLEVVLYFSVIVLPVTTLIIIKAVKKHDYDLIDKAITNPFWPKLNLNFFPAIWKEYSKNNNSNLVVILNKISFFAGTVGFILFIILVVLNEMITLSK